MKPVFFLCLTCILIACKKSNQILTDSELRITYISELGKISYEGERLTSIANTNLIYNPNGNLIGARIFNIDTTITNLPVYKPNGEIDYSTSKNYYSIKEDLLRYSFSIEGGIIKAIMVDSFVSSSKTIMPSPSDEWLAPHSINIYTNLPEAIYYYTGNRLDSIEHLFSINGNQIKKSIFSYNGAGNISTTTDYYFTEGSSVGGFPMIATRKSVTTYEYDNYQNPWHWLYKKTGVILPGVPAHNISPNNPVKATSVFDIYDHQLTANIVYNYSYNKNGYPLTMTTNIDGGNSTTITFHY